MEGTLPNTSALPRQNQHNIGIRGLLSSAVGVLIAGIFIGGIIFLGVLRIPRDRIVVFNQPTSTMVRLSSVRLSKPGFAVIYIQEESGWKAVGSTWYLRPGYYRDVVVDIGYQPTIENHDKDNTIGNIQHRAFVARLFEYKGTTFQFDELIDMPVMGRNGKIYQKRFWWEARGNPVLHFLHRLQDDPLGFIWDSLWP